MYCLRYRHKGILLEIKFLCSHVRIMNNLMISKINCLIIYILSFVYTLLPCMLEICSNSSKLTYNIRHICKVFWRGFWGYTLSILYHIITLNHIISYYLYKLTLNSLFKRALCFAPILSKHIIHVCTCLILKLYIKYAAIIINFFLPFFFCKLEIYKYFIIINT